MVSGPSLRHGRGPSLSRLNPPWQRPKCILGAGAEGGPPRVDPQLQEWRGFQTASVTSYRVHVPFPGTGCVLASCRSRSSPGTASPSCPKLTAWDWSGGRPLLCKGRQKWAPPHKEQRGGTSPPRRTWPGHLMVECLQRQARNTLCKTAGSPEVGVWRILTAGVW